MDEVGLSLDAESASTPEQAQRRRDPAFREKVLLACEYRCCVCVHDLRMGGHAIGLEAAHIKWFQAHGPDVVSRQIEALLTGSNYPAIKSGDVRALQIPFPEYDEQTAIAATLSDMDAEIAALEEKLANARGLKQAMMQELLIGRIRLV
jgi:Type I restriction modification DNA specificity domain